MSLLRPLEGLLELLGPSRCPGCDHLHAGQLPLCDACTPLLEHAGTTGAERGLWRFEGPLADAVHRFKYRGRSDLARSLAQTLWLGLAEPDPVDVVVPVPLHPSRLRARGYNQSALLAAGLARRLGARLEVRALDRVRATESQVGASRARRAANVRGAFVARWPLEGARVLVVDDVRTSGATLAEACRVAGEAGAGTTWGLALAQANLDGTTPL